MNLHGWLDGIKRRLGPTASHRRVSRMVSGMRGRRASRAATLAASIGRLEERMLLAAVSWDGGAGDGLWTSGSNWSTDVAPGTNDDVTIDVAGVNTIRLTTGNITVRSLHSQENLEINGASLRVTTGVSDLAGDLALVNATLTAEGATADFEAAGAVTLTGSSLIAKSGGRLTLTTATTVGGGTTAGDRFLQAESGGIVDLTGVTSLTSNTLGYTTFVRAFGGGQVLLPGVTGITNHSVGVYAQDNGSHVDLSGLTTWNGQFPNGRTSALEGRAGTTVDVSSLTTLRFVDVTVRGAGTLPIAQITTLENGDVRTDGRVAEFTGLTNAKGSSFYAQGAGGVLRLPSMTTHDAGASAGDRLLQAESGGVLDLANFTSLTSNTLGYTTFVRAFGGGQVLLPGVTAITNQSVGVYAQDNGSKIDLSGLTTWNGRFPNGRTSSLEARPGTTLSLSPGNLDTTQVALTLGGVTVSAGALHLGVGSSLAGSGTLIGDLFNDFGVVNPAFDVAGLTIDGDYVQGATAVYHVDVNGTTTAPQVDRLNVTGSATLAGTLQIQTTNPLLVPPGQILPVITFASRSGAFDPVTGADAGFGVHYVSAHNAQDVTLRAAGPVLPPGSAATPILPTVPGDGVRIDLFNGFGGGAAPTPAALAGRTPSGQTLSSFIDFPNPGNVINVGTSFDNFFRSTTTPPDQVQGLPASNFTLRSNFFLRVSDDLDKIPSTPEIDFLVGVGSDDGFHLTIGDEVLGSAGDRPFTYSWRWVSFQSEGMYPVQLLFAANAIGQSGLELSWDTATSGGARIIPQSALYVNAATGDRAVTFEEVPTGTAITDQFRDLGVIFQNVGGNLQTTNANPGQFVPVSPTRVYADPGSNPAQLGQVNASFVLPGTNTPATTNFVGFYVIDAQATGATVKAFDPTGVVVFDRSYHAGGGTQEYVAISHPRIARVEVTLGQGDDTAAIDNFVFNAPTSQPDLVVDSVSPAESSANFNRPLDVSWTTRNTGIAPVTTSWTERIWLSTDTVLDGSDTLLLTRPSTVSSLASQGFVETIATVNLPPTGLEGTYYLIVETDAAGNVAEWDEVNWAVSGPVDVTIPPLPDLSPSNVAASTSSAAPGETIHVTWTTLNSGSAAPTGPVTEQVYLSDDNIVGNDRLVGTFAFDSIGPGAPRDVAVTLPTFGLGSGGNIYVGVRTDAPGTIEELDELNNSAISAAAVNVPLRLELTFPAGQVAEGGAPIRGLVTRTGSTSLPLTVTLTSSDPSELAVPTTVVIPAGHSGVAVALTPVVDSMPDGNNAVSVTAEATGFTSSNAGLTVLDVDVADLTLDIPAETITEGESLTVTLTRSFVTDQPLVVSLTNSSGAQVGMPTTVIIPANEARTTFVLQAFQNFIPEAPASVTLTASATGYHTAAEVVQVIDDDLPVLALALNRSTITESDGIAALTATLSRGVATSQPLAVHVTVAGSTKLLFPQIVTIAANQTSVSFDVNVLDNTLVDGNQTATLSAVGLFPADNAPIVSSQTSAQVVIQDNDGPTLSLSLGNNFVGEGLSAATIATLTRNTGTTVPLVVTLTSSDASEATVAAEVTIPAGAASVQFDVATIADGVADGAQTVTIAASASGFTSGAATLVVSDEDLPDLVIGGLTGPANAITDTVVDVSFEVRNAGRKDAAGTLTQRLLLSTDPFVGNDVVLGTYTFTGILRHTAPLDHFSQTVSVRLPQIEGDYWLIAVADVNNAVFEGLESNNARISATPIHVQAAYTATVGTNVTTALMNAPIPLAGSAVAAITGLPAPFALVNIDITVGGVKRTISAITDAAGQFSTTFQPLRGEGGHYTVTAYHPGSRPGPVQDEFAIVGMTAEPSKTTVKLIEGQSALNGEIAIRNLSTVPLTAVNAQLVSAPANVTAQLTLGNGEPDQSLSGPGALNLRVALSAADDSITSGTVLIRLTSAEGAMLDVPIEVTIESFRPRLVASIERLVSGMLPGQQRVVEFTVTNEGGAETGPIELRLPNVSWITSPTGTALPTLLPGASAKVVIQLLPPADLPLGEYTGNFALAAAETSLSVPFTFRNLSEAKGDLSIDVVDEYTFYAEGAPHVAGATITLTDTLTGIVVFTGTSDATGRSFVPALAEGYYDLRVEAEDHATFDETILVEAGKENSIQPFLARQAVQYLWTVEPTEVADRTRITVTSTFETNVPLPVIVVEGAIDLSLVSPETDSAQYEIVVRNEGLIAAENVQIQFPGHPGWTFTPLISDIGVLAARSSVTIPVVVKRNYTIITERERIDLTRFEGLEELAFAPDLFSQLLSGAVSQTSLLASGADDLRSSGDEVISADSDDVAGLIADLTRRELQAAVALSVARTSNLKYSVEHFSHWLGRFGHNTDFNSFALSPPNEASDIPDYGPDSEVAQMAKETMTFDRMRKAAEEDILKAIDDYVCQMERPGTLPVIIDTQQMNFHRFSNIGETIEFFAHDLDLFGAFGNMNWDGPDGQTKTPYAMIEITKLENGTDKCGQKVKKWEATLTFYQFDYYDFQPTEPQAPLQPHGWASNFHTSITMEFDIKGETQCDKGKSSGPCQTAGEVTYTYVCAGRDIQNASSFPIYNAGCGCSSPEFENSARPNVSFSHLQGGGLCQPVLIATATASSGTESGDPVQTAAASAGVCAQVELQISQDLVQTRAAFDASLKISNLTDGTLANVGADLVIRDANGQDATARFGIRPAELSGVTAVDGTGTIDPGATGAVRWLIIPTSDAAPTGPVTYTVSGSLRYTDAGSNVVIQLAEVQITVLPDPLLQIHYFHQRDVISDDPFTNEIEPAQPYNLGVMVENAGYGIARNVSITSAQPQIVENEKGLLIGFQILATEVEGQNLVPSLTANFGTIDAGAIAQARWLFASTLQGQFIDYNATFEHIDGLGNKKLSLVESVDIHELIHLVTAGGSFDDGRFDYLVNDIPDDHDTPDTIWLSNGDVMPVAEATDEAVDGPVAPGDLEVALNAGVGAGWNFIELADPGNGLYRLAHVVRSDGVEVPVGDNVSGGNAWQTDRTFIEHGQRPILENKLHILDFGGTGQYTLVYEKYDVIGPGVMSITGPAPVVTAPVDSLTVTFSKNFDAGTLTTADLTLTRNGDPTNLITSGISIVQLDATRYRIDGLAAVTAADGEYDFTVDATGIVDFVGNPGVGFGTFGWTKAAAVPAVAGITGVGSSPRNAPVDVVSVSFTQPIDLSTFDAGDLAISLDGAPVSLAGASLGFSQIGPGSYRIEGLAPVTAAEGDYTLTISGSGVTGTNGVAGIGVLSVSWTMDTTAPEIIDLTGLPVGAANSPADTVEVTFSEPLAAGSLTAGDIHLTRNAAPLDTGGLAITSLGSSKYRIAGLAALTADEGGYVLSIDGASIADLAGNSGTGLTLHAWTVDMTAPAAAHGLSFTPDSGVTGDGVTNTRSIVVSGQVDEPAVTVALFDVTNGQSLGGATLDGTSFTKPIDFAVVGNHQLRVRVSDAAGNFADSFFDVFVDQSAPTANRFVGVPAGVAAPAPNAIDIVFTEPIDAATFGRGNLTLTRNGGPDLLPATVELTQLDATTFRLAGLSGLAGQDGSYELTIHATGIVDRAGNGGTASVAARWVRDTVSQQPATLRGKVFNDANGNKVLDPGEAPLGGWAVFLDANRSGAFEPGERSTTTDGLGEYVFENLAPGTYAVAQLLPDGWVQTFPGDSPAVGAAIAAGNLQTVAAALNAATAGGSMTIIDDVTADGPAASIESAGSGFTWADRNPSTPDVIDIYYDFRDQNGFANEITGVQRALAEQALAGWAAASGGRLNFVRSTTASASEIINIGSGELAALGYVSGAKRTLGLGGGMFSQAGATRTISDGVVWLDAAESWDNAIGNGDVTGTYDFFSIVSREIGHALGLATTQTDPNGAAISIADGSPQFLLFQSHCGCGGVPVNGLKYASETTTLSAGDGALIQALYGGTGAGSETNAGGSNGFYTGARPGFAWADRDPATTDVIEVHYDFRSLNGHANQITSVQIALAEQALIGWSQASAGRVRFVRDTAAPDSEVILIGTGDLAALGGVSSVRGTLALGGATFTTVAGQRVVTAGKAWLDFAENWDVTFANGDPAGTYDFFTVVAHEIGHALGLGHTDSLPGPDILDGAYSGERTAFSAHDQFLVRSLYGAAPAGGGSVVGGPSWNASSVPVAALGVHVVTVGFNQTLDNLDFGADQVSEPLVIQSVTPVSPNPRRSPVSNIEVRFSAPLDVATLTAADLTLSRDGGQDLLTDGVPVKVSLIPGTTSTYRISGLQTETGVNGAYTFTIDAGGVQDADGHAGNGTASVSWTLDTIVPKVAKFAPVAPNPREVPVDFLDVTFSQPIDTASFDVSDLSLTKDAVPISLVGSTVEIDFVSGTTYRIGGLTNLTNVDGRYRLTVDAGGVLDAADGTAGTGSLATGWMLKRVPPKVKSFTPVSPNPRNSAVDAVEFTFSEPIDPTTFDLGDLSLRRNSVVLPWQGTESLTHVSGNTWRISGLAGLPGLPGLTGVDGKYTLTVNTAGILDANGVAGVESKSTGWSEDYTRPSVTSFGGVPANPSTVPVETLTIRFSERIDPATFDLGDLSLTRDGTAIPLTGSTVSLQPASATSPNWQLTGLGGLTAQAGRYVLTVNAAGLQDLVGHAGRRSRSVSWDIDTPLSSSSDESLASSIASSLSPDRSLTNGEEVPRLLVQDLDELFSQPDGVASLVAGL